MKQSAGILLYKFEESLNLFEDSKVLKVFLVHPGGPYFKNKDEGFWSIPKGEIEENEDAFKTALREIKEETNIFLDENGNFLELGSVVQKSGKTVFAWAVEFDGNIEVDLKTNITEIEWPPKSGKKITIPENDKGQFFEIPEAEVKINSAQKEFLLRLQQAIKNPA